MPARHLFESSAFRWVSAWRGRAMKVFRTSPEQLSQLLSFPPHPRLSSKPSAAVAFHRNKTSQSNHDPPRLLESSIHRAQHGKLVREPEHRRFHRRDGRRSKSQSKNDAAYSASWPSTHREQLKGRLNHPPPTQLRWDTSLPNPQGGMPRRYGPKCNLSRS